MAVRKNPFCHYQQMRNAILGSNPELTAKIGYIILN